MLDVPRLHRLAQRACDEKDPDAEYAEPKALRQATADSELVIVQGV